MKRKELLTDSAMRLLGKVTEDQDQAYLEAELIISSVLKKTRVQLLTSLDDQINETEANKVKSAIRKRLNRTPLQHITKQMLFHGKSFEVNDQVFIPRFDTEMLCEIAYYAIFPDLRNPLKPALRLLDMCTGSGVIAITLMTKIIEYLNTQSTINLEKIEVVAVDINPESIKLTAKNIKKILPISQEIDKNRFKIVLDNEVEISITLVISDAFKSLPDTHKFDFIISNPPYLPLKNQESWEPEINHDPLIALVSGEDGLDFYREIINNLPHFLVDGGKFFGELEPDTVENLKRLLGSKGLHYNFSKGLYNELRFVEVSF